MLKTLEIINRQFKGVYVTIEDRVGNVAEGIFEKFEWEVPADIYTGGDIKLRCFLTPKFPEDVELYGVNDEGFIEKIFDINSVLITPLDENGNKKINHRLSH